MTTQLQQLILAKKESDRGNYKMKHQILVSLLQKSREDFKVDSEQNGIVGLTHTPTHFKIHQPKHILPMPQTSKKQQRLFGKIRAYQKGELKDAPAFIKRMAKDIKPDSVLHFAATKHDGLPAKAASDTFMQTNQVLTSYLDKVAGKYGTMPALKGAYHGVESGVSGTGSTAVPASRAMTALKNLVKPQARPNFGSTTGAAAAKRVDPIHG